MLYSVLLIQFIRTQADQPSTTLMSDESVMDATNTDVKSPPELKPDLPINTASNFTMKSVSLMPSSSSTPSMAAIFTPLPPASSISVVGNQASKTQNEAPPTSTPFSINYYLSTLNSTMKPNSNVDSLTGVKGKRVTGNHENFISEKDDNTMIAIDPKDVSYATLKDGSKIVLIPKSKVSPILELASYGDKNDGKYSHSNVGGSDLPEYNRSTLNLNGVDGDLSVSDTAKNNGNSLDDSAGKLLPIIGGNMTEAFTGKH